MSNAPKPPPGFVPMSQAMDNRPEPPPGFVPVVNESPSMLDDFSRQLGLTGRALAGGMAQAVEPFTEPVRYLLNQALPGNPVGNIEAATDEVLTQAGVPEPRGAVERGVQSASRFVTSAGTGLGLERGAERALRNTLGGKWGAETAPTLEELRQTGKAAYQAADDAGLVVNPGSFKNFVTNLRDATRQAGIDKNLHPKSWAVLKRFDEAVEAGEPIKLKDIEILRRVAGAARSSSEKAERDMGQRIVAQLDDYINRMGDADVIAGDRKGGIEALNLARNTWSRMSRSEEIQDAVEKAGIRAGQFSGSGFENALRTQFRQIAMSPRRMRGFSPEEQEAIKKVAMGGKLDNAFRDLGKLAPTGVVSATLGGGAAYALAGPAGPPAAWLAGTISRKIATEMTKKNVRNVDSMVRRGGPNPQEAPEWLLPWLSGGIFGVDTQE